MTFKQCVLFCLQAPIAAWENMSGRYYVVNLCSHFWQVLAVLLNVAIGLVLAALTPVLAPVMYGYRRASAEKRAAAQLARDRARFEDL